MCKQKCNFCYSLLFSVEIKVYHPPPQPPPSPSNVHPIPCKPSEEKNSKHNKDASNLYVVPRSFTSDDDEYEDGDINHTISISDGESENYYAGTLL